MPSVQNLRRLNPFSAHKYTNFNSFSTKFIGKYPLLCPVLLNPLNKHQMPLVSADCQPKRTPVPYSADS